MGHLSASDGFPPVSDFDGLAFGGGLGGEGAEAAGGGGRPGGGAGAGGPLPTSAVSASASATDLSSTVTFCGGFGAFC